MVILPELWFVTYLVKYQYLQLNSIASLEFLHEVSELCIASDSKVNKNFHLRRLIGIIIPVFNETHLGLERIS